MQYLLKLDFVGKRPEFKINNKSHYQTILGFLFTLVIFSLTILNSLSTIRNYIYKTFPMMSEEYKKDFDNMYFDKENNNPVMFAYAYVDLDLSLKMVNISDFKDENGEISLRGPFITYFNSKDNNYQVNLDNKNNYMKPCNYTDIRKYKNHKNDLYENNYWEDYLSKVNSSYCFPNKNEVEDSNYSYIDDKGNGHSTVLAINRSITKTLLSKSRLLNINMLVMFYERTYFTPGNSTQFYTKRLEYELFPLSEDKMKIYNVNFIKTKTTRDYSEFFMTNEFEDIFITVEKVFIQAEVFIPSFILNSDNANISNLVLNLNKSAFLKIYSFKYIGISDIISSLGGSFKPIFFIFKFIYILISMFNYKAYLLNSIFQYHTSNEESNIEYKKINTLMTIIQERRNSLFPKTSIDYGEKSFHKEDNCELSQRKL